MNEQPIAHNISKLLKRVRLSAEKYHRHPDSVKVLAASKTWPAEAIRTAFDCGLRDFGENYLQEAEQKIAELSELPLRWHFIGPIQSNKTRAIAEKFHWVHSVDREKIARRLSQQRPPGLPPLQVCLQFNVSGEASKSGVNIADLRALAQTVSGLPQLQLRGLMAIPEATADISQQRSAFAAVRNALEALQAELPELDTLSMGMSADLESAISEGATVVRVGTAIFGPRG